MFVSDCVWKTVQNIFHFFSKAIAELHCSIKGLIRECAEKTFSARFPKKKYIYPINSIVVVLCGTMTIIRFATQVRLHVCLLKHISTTGRGGGGKSNRVFLFLSQHHRRRRVYGESSFLFLPAFTMLRIHIYLHWFPVNNNAVSSPRFGARYRKCHVNSGLYYTCIIGM